MGNAEILQVEQRSGDLMGQLLHFLFCELIILGFIIMEKGASVQVLHDYVDVLMVLKDVEQSDNVGVLADLEDLNLSLVQLEVFWVHFLLFQDFDGDFLPCFLVDSQLDLTELSLPNRFFDVIIVHNRVVPNRLLDLLHPSQMRSLIN